MDQPRGYMLSETSQRNMISLICGIYKTKQTNATKQKETQRYRDQPDGHHGGGGERNE